MARLSEVPYDFMVKMEDFIRDRTHRDKVSESVVRFFMGKAHAEAVRMGDSKLAFSLLLEAIDVVWNLRHSLAATAIAPDPYHGRLWVHSTRFPGETKAGPWTIEQWVPDQQAAEDAAADYLKHPWMSDGHLDWCLVDALTRREIVGYEEAVAKHASKALELRLDAPKAVLGLVSLAYRGGDRRRVDIVAPSRVCLSRREFIPVVVGSGYWSLLRLVDRQGRSRDSCNGAGAASSAEGAAGDC